MRLPSCFWLSGDDSATLSVFGVRQLGRVASVLSCLPAEVTVDLFLTQANTTVYTIGEAQMVRLLEWGRHCIGRILTIMIIIIIVIIIMLV